MEKTERKMRPWHWTFHVSLQAQNALRLHKMHSVAALENAPQPKWQERNGESCIKCTCSSVFVHIECTLGERSCTHKVQVQQWDSWDFRGPMETSSLSFCLKVALDFSNYQTLGQKITHSDLARRLAGPENCSIIKCVNGAGLVKLSILVYFHHHTFFIFQTTRKACGKNLVTVGL